MTCSIERIPSFTARRMSLAVTSFWKSVNALRPGPTGGTAIPSPPRSPSTAKPGGSAASPSARAAAAPARAPSSSAAAMPHAPLPAPATWQASLVVAGRKAAPSHVSDPLVWEKRCTEGVQPPPIRSASHATVSCPVPTSNVTAETRRRPVVATGTAPERTRMPRAAAALASAGSGPGRASAMAATLMPASARSNAVCQIESWQPARTTFRPTATP